MPAIAENTAQQRDPSRSRSAAEPPRAGAPFIRHSGAVPSRSAGATPWCLTASLSPGMRISLVEDAAPECGLGALGSGSTLGIDWLEVTPYDSEPAGSGAMLALGRGSKPRSKGTGGLGPTIAEHEGNSAGCGGAGQEEGDKAMADSDIDNLPTYRLGALETKVDRLQEDVKALDGRVANLSERVANLSERVAAICERLSALYERVTGFEQRVENRFDKQDENFENRFDKQDERSDRQEDRQRSDFRVLFRSILAIGGLILAAETGLIAELASAVSSLFP